ncbi:MAG: alpha/beta hydrolase [Pseudomonadota bacterium]
MSRVTVDGVALSVIDIPYRRAVAGRPPATPIVFVHGLAASSAMWYAPAAKFFSLLGPCLLYDLRGHGKSDMPERGYGISRMADDLLGLLDARGIDRAHLVAHSFGGMICLLFALRHPERVASLVLADVRLRQVQSALEIETDRIMPALKARLLELGVDAAGLERARDGIDYLTEVARIEVAAGPNAGDILRAIYRHPRLFRSRRNAMRWIQLTERASLAEDVAELEFAAADIARIACPILALVGGNSPTVASARAIARICPNAILKEVPDVGHFFPIAHPKLFARPTFRFLRAVNRQEAASDRAAPA